MLVPEGTIYRGFTKVIFGFEKQKFIERSVKKDSLRPILF
jgi:hypothetical protein